MSWAIDTISLTKRFPISTGWRGLFRPQQYNPPAVNGVSLTVDEGELFGLVGPNGAGKTTIIKLLSTLILPTSGSARVNGYDLHQETDIKASIGLVTSDERSFYWRLTGRQNLDFFASLHGLPPKEIGDTVQSVLDEVALADVADKRFQTFSTGMRQRLSIARALLNRPRLLFLDEPTKGLDPTATGDLHKLIKERLTLKEGITVFMTTHDLSEAEKLCDRIAIMNHGQIFACGTMEDLRNELYLGEGYSLRVDCLGTELINHLEAQIKGIKVKHIHLNNTASIDATDRRHAAFIEFQSLDRGRTLNKIIDILREGNAVIQAISQEQPSLETIFTHYIHQRDIDGEENKDESDKSHDIQLGMEQPSKSIGNYEDGAESTRSTGQTLQFNLFIAQAFLKRDTLNELSYRFSFLLQILGIFFSIGVFYFIAELFGEAATPYLEQYGGDYFSFVLIGIAFSGYFGVGLSGFSNSLRRSQTTGTLEAMLTTPTSLSTIIISSSLWDYFLTTVRVFIYLFIGVTLLGVELQDGNYFAAIIILILTIITFSSLGIIAASFIMVVKRGDPITWIVSSLSSLLGGVYYPIEILPEWMQLLARLIPVTYALEAMRLALLEGASISTLYPDILALIIFSVLLLPLSLFSFRFAVNRAKLDGSLTHY